MYIFWTIAGIILLILDLLKTNTLKLTGASTCLFCAIIAYKFPQNNLYQIYAFFAFGMLFYSLIKVVLKKEQTDLEKLNSLDDIEGKTAIVKKDIGKTLSIDGLGYIEYNNQLWSAKSVDDKEIKAGKKVIIVSRENMIMNVKVDKNAD